MEITPLNKRPDLAGDTKAARIYDQFDRLLHELRGRALSQEAEHLINKSVEELNASALSGRPLIKAVQQKQGLIIKRMEQDFESLSRYRGLRAWCQSS